MAGTPVPKAAPQEVVPTGRISWDIGIARRTLGLGLFAALVAACGPNKRGTGETNELFTGRAALGTALLLDPSSIDPKGVGLLWSTPSSKTASGGGC